MRITKVTTRTGDDGTTGLADGSRVPKDDPRLEAYGTVDELGAILGAAVASARGAIQAGLHADAHAQLEPHLRFVQNQLFTVGGDLATPLASRFPGMPLVGEAELAYLERLVDAFNASLPPLKDFVLAGEPETAARLQWARCVCRRAERATRSLARRDDVGAWVIPYLNRLSDALFVLARWITLRCRATEEIWLRSMPEPPLPR
ncbi:MAG: cob(I)yrinic acid a,c-diamide adenosyltransferase [Planctomycetes bacterium]|nr:cob(I)yrinic acid a,c-diamide adenosyltransferase [Planctomycetota bacterium]